MSLETFALALVAVASAGMAVFIYSAFVIASDADDEIDRLIDDSAHGDWPNLWDIKER